MNSSGLHRIQLTQDWGSRKRGAIVEVDEVRALAMIDRGIAAEPGSVPESGPDERTSDEDRKARRPRRKLGE